MYIYDYVKVDKILGRLQIEPNQFHLLYLLYHRKEGQVTNAQIERFKAEVLRFWDETTLRRRVKDLIIKGLLEDFNPHTVEGGSTYKYYDVDNFLVTSKFMHEVAMATEEHGEEFWQHYPATFPINTTRFIARAGDKDKIIKNYLRRIKYDEVMHRFVLTMVDSYRELVTNGELNAHKIGDFVDGEMWYVIEEVKKENDGRFGKDI